MNKAIEINNLCFKYPDDKLVLDKINLDVDEGESIGIIGPNGAGKTTLVLHLNGILRGLGVIKISGIEINDKTIKEIRKKVGVVFQNPDDQLFSQTVFDDIAFGLDNMGFDIDIVNKRVLESLEYVQMAGFEDKLPHHLSVGEKRKLQ